MSVSAVDGANGAWNGAWNVGAFGSRGDFDEDFTDALLTDALPKA